MIADEPYIEGGRRRFLILASVARPNRDASTDRDTGQGVQDDGRPDRREQLSITCNA